MGTEIERKFLTTSDGWQRDAIGIPYVQGYISRGTGRTVRIRIAGDKAFLTIKGAVSGISRAEFEYPIPLDDARELLRLCEGPIIKKKRFHIPFQGHLWEVDLFEGENSGLIVAEVELSHSDENVSLPPWVGREVTGDPRYYNSNLTVHPFCKWGADLA